MIYWHSRGDFKFAIYDTVSVAERDNREEETEAGVHRNLAVSSRNVSTKAGIHPNEANETVPMFRAGQARFAERAGFSSWWNATAGQVQEFPLAKGRTAQR